MKKSLLILITIPVLLFLLIAFAILCIASEIRAEKLYRQGIKFEKQNDFQNAYYNYSKINIFARIYPLALYKQGYSALNAADKKTALKKYKGFIRFNGNNKLLAPSAYWQIGVILVNQEKEKEALRIFKKLQKKFPDSDYAKASNYFIGTLEKNNHSIDNMAKYLEYAPNGRFSKNAIRYLEDNKTKLNEEEKIILGIAYLKNDEYEKSLSYLNTCNFDDTWLYIAQDYEKMNRIPDAQKTYLNGFKTQKTTTKFSHEELNSALNSYISNFPLDKKTGILYILRLTGPTKNRSHFGALFKYAQYLPDEEAYQVYSKIYQLSPKNYYAPSALSEMIYYNYKTKKYKEAVEFGKIQKKNYRYSNATPYALFWSAKAALKLKNTTLAKDFLNTVILDNPDSYYAMRAGELLSNRPNSFLNEYSNIQIDKKKSPIPFPVSYGGQTKFYIEKLVELNDINTLSDIRSKDKFVESWVAYKTGRVAYSNVLAREEMSNLYPKPNIKDPKWKLLYPIYYSDTINKYSQQFNVPPYLILSIIKEESHFDPNIKSPAGAAGLMQVMPSTAKMVGGANINIENEDNGIYLGTKYFSDIVKMYKGSETFGVIGYNSGPFITKEWINNTTINDIDEFIEDIPYPETKNYLKKVYTSYYNYTRIYCH